MLIVLTIYCSFENLVVNELSLYDCIIRDHVPNAFYYCNWLASVLIYEYLLRVLVCLLLLSCPRHHSTRAQSLMNPPAMHDAQNGDIRIRSSRVCFTVAVITMIMSELLFYVLS